MKLQWHVDQADIQRVQSFVASRQADPFVRLRAERNLAAIKPAVDRSEFWKQIVVMRMTSVQRSGPNSAVAKFFHARPFPLSFEYVTNISREDWPIVIASTIRNHGGIRFSDRIAEDLSPNLEHVASDHRWATISNELDALVHPVGAQEERAVARFVQRLLKGFGPKQSRNLLQALGLTRYEIPLDSRIAKWLRKFGFPIALTPSALADVGYYEFALDGFQALCAASEVFPCILDAAIFASFDEDAWTEQNLIY